MKRIYIALIVMSALIIAGPIGYGCFLGYRVAKMVGDQMDIGRVVLDRISPHALTGWAKRSDALWGTNPSANDLGIYGPSNSPVPRDLAALGIIRIDIFKNEIYYVWCGGMDHCALIVERTTDGLIKFTAQYNDETFKPIGTVKSK